VRIGDVAQPRAHARAHDILAHQPVVAVDHAAEEIGHRFIERTGLILIDEVGRIFGDAVGQLMGGDVQSPGER